jgi:hypothetical protein
MVLLRLVQFLVRWLALNGLVAVAVGLVMWFAFDFETAGPIVVMAGAAAVALGLLAEVRGLTRAVASHRGAAGFNSLLQILLAAALVIGGNVYSFRHYVRFDWTKRHTFTLNDDLRARLAKLRGDTDIIVYLPHVSFGQRVDLRQDDYDQAAEKIITRKVEDLVEQFGEIGPRFRVTIYDTQKKNKKAIRHKINELSGQLTEAQLAANLIPTKDHPAKDSELLETIEKAPENSIFFYSQETKNLQRLSFNDIYYLDKKASEEANDGNGNLVLIDQGVQTFADKVFKIEEKKPRIGIAVVHGFLGQDGSEIFGIPAFKKMMASRDFEARDIVLWKRLQVEPAALEHEENRFEMLATSKVRYERALESDTEELKELVAAREFWEKNTAAAIDKDYALVMTFDGLRRVSRKDLEQIQKKQGRVFQTRPITEGFREAILKDLAETVEFMEKEVATDRRKLDKASEEQSKLQVDNLEEQRRIADVRVKFNRLLANIDVLVVPRFTLWDLVERRAIPADVHTWDGAHIEAIKDFMKAGKPVLFCLGPMAREGGGPDADADSLEKLLTAFNIQLPNQAILFNTEGDALEERDERSQMGGASVVIPPVEFDWRVTEGSKAVRAPDGRIPPVLTSMRLTTRGFGEKSRDGLRIRYPRPVYVERTIWPADAVASMLGSIPLCWPGGPVQALTTLHQKGTKKYDDSAVFMMTSPDCWNENRPFPTERRIPHFERPKADDPTKGTLLETRRGPFPIAVAVEAEVPADWYGGDPDQTPKKVRLAVIGDGALFVGRDKLAPLREKLFLDVANWLLGRENLLARESPEPWQYPRIHLEPEIKSVWEWGARLGLPLLFVYLGLNVWLVRRMR